MPKTYEEINEKIKKGKAVVVTAEEIIDIVKEKGAKKAADTIDVVTTATFGPMCSSGALLNTGHTSPRMNFKSGTLNGVPAYCGIAAVDLYIGATAIPEDDPANKVFPGRFSYGGGHVIEDLIAGREVIFKAESYGSHCYPMKELETRLTIKDLNTATLLNPRNAYQNYNVAVNAHAKYPLYTYMGILRPNFGNASYCSAGQLSPLLNDPDYRTIGIGTRIFLGGGVGYVIDQGTQHNPTVGRNEKGIPKGGAGTLALMGDMKGMDARFIRGASFTGYGPSLAVGIGVPIPVLDEEVAAACAITDADIQAPVWDYSEDYPGLKGKPIKHVSYAELRSGCIDIDGKKVETAALSSLPRAREIAKILKEWVTEGKFMLSEPVQHIANSKSGLAFKGLEIRALEKDSKGRKR